MPSTITPDLDSLGWFVRRRRLELGLTQTELAERTAWVQERVSVLERGKYGMPSLPLLARLARALQVPLPQLLQAAGFDVEEFQEEDEDAETHRDALLYVLERLLRINATNLKDALEQSVDLLVHALGAEKVDAFLYDAAADALIAAGTSDTPMARRQQELGLDYLPLSRGGRIVEVFTADRPFRSGRLGEDPGALRGAKEDLGVRSVVCVPLHIDGERRGALLASSSRPDQFTEEDEAFLDTVAHWVGTVAHRAELAQRVAAGTVVPPPEGLDRVRRCIEAVHGRARDEGRSDDIRDLEIALAELVGAPAGKS